VVVVVAAVGMIVYLENSLPFLQIKHISIYVTVCTGYCVLWRQYV
jgi:hypothetical protein